MIKLTKQQYQYNGQFSGGWAYRTDSGLLHKEDGPAVYMPNSSWYGYYLYSTNYNFYLWCRILKKTEAEIATILLEYS